MPPSERLPPAHPYAKPILLTGATGYIGGRLAGWLLAAGWRVRCLVRSPDKLSARPWAQDPRVECVTCDLADGQAVAEAMRGCGAAYYLVHSMMMAGRAFADRDQELATIFAKAATTAGLERIIYLGGLGETGPGLSEHLSSRQEVERALAGGQVPLTSLRAAIIIGSGSASFEILRYLVDRLPAMITPRWVATECQPIAVRNVLHYLVACLSTPATVGKVLDIGGTEVLSYRQLMHTMAACAGLRRRIIMPVPVLTPHLSSLWIHLVTPVSREIARPLAEGLRNRVVCRSDEAARLMPQTLLSVEEAIRLSLGRVELNDVETRWSDAGVMPGDPAWAGGTVLRDQREREVRASAGAVFRAVCRVGGEHGWYATDHLWRLRGWLDRMVGGPGLRRGRRDPLHLRCGDAVDFWRVVVLEPDQRLVLAAEMKLPGEARLEFTINSLAPDRCRLTQTASFRPHGLTGLGYWYTVLPLHSLVFPRMIKGIATAAEMGH